MFPWQLTKLDRYGPHHEECAALEVLHLSTSHTPPSTHHQIMRLGKLVAWDAWWCVWLVCVCVCVGVGVGG